MDFAAMTKEFINQCWRDHPDIFVCGLGRAHGDKNLERKSAPEDWMSIVRDACTDLGQLGYRWCYLILDDHPPLDTCHAHHLNKTIPELLDTLHATSICLNGWGYGREGRRIKGEILSPTLYHLEHLPKDFEWKYSLHPSIWDLQRLEKLLTALISKTAQKKRTPWCFERVVCQPGLDVDFDYLDSAYRICGRYMVSRPAAWRWHYLDYLVARARRFVMSRLASAEKSRRSFETLFVIEQFYYGPYPLFWSGMVTKGRLNQAFARYIEIRGSRELKRAIEKLGHQY
jgi:hypothetical protein